MTNKKIQIKDYLIFYDHWHAHFVISLINFWFKQEFVFVSFNNAWLFVTSFSINKYNPYRKSKKPRNPKHQWKYLNIITIERKSLYI